MKKYLFVALISIIIGFFLGLMVIPRRIINETEISKIKDINRTSEITFSEIVIPEKISMIEDKRYYNEYEIELLSKAEKKFIGRNKDQMNFVFEILKKYIKPGNTILDLGCGNGWYTFFLSQLVRNEGKVYASDVDTFTLVSLMVQKKHLQRKYLDEPFNNIVPMLNEENNIFQQKKSIDVVWLSDVHILHVNMNETIIGLNGKEENIELIKIEKYGYEKQQKELYKTINNNQKKILSNIYECIKTEGYFIVSEDITGHPQKLKKELVIKLIESYGFNLLEDASLPKYHLLVFKKIK